MKTLKTALLLVVFVGAIFAADNDALTVTYEVQAINELVAGADVTLTISTATAGSDPDDATDASTYDLTTNCGADAKKITAAIDTDMPAGLTLSLNAAAPTGGTSAGATTISSSAADVVTGVDAVSEGGIALNFTLSATAEAGVVASATKTLTLTIVNS